MENIKRMYTALWAYSLRKHYDVSRRVTQLSSSRASSTSKLPTYVKENLSRRKDWNSSFGSRHITCLSCEKSRVQKFDNKLITNMATSRLFTRVPTLCVRKLLHQSILDQSTVRCISYNTPLYAKKPEVKPPGKMAMIVEKKYIGFMARFEKGLENRWPKAHKLYILVKQGIKDFFIDSKTLYKVSTDMWKGKKPTEMTYYELEVYRQMPHDMVKVAPVLLIAALPFAPYVIFPLAYLFPRHLLCRHFWTPEQTRNFSLHYLKSRVPHYSKVLKYMESHSQDVKDPGLRRMLNGVIHTLEQGKELSVEQIVEIKPAFHDDQTFGRAYLSSRHKLLTRHLALGMNLSTLSNRMSQQALLLHHIDLALLRDGITSLSNIQLLQACFLRGLNATELKDAQMISYLTKWTEISKHTDESSLSLLMHSPVFLALNHPANARLVGSSVL